MNVWCGSGRLVRDSNVNYTKGENQMCVARFTVACDRKGKDKGADFINCVAFDKRGEFLEKYGKKGVKFDIVGHIQTGSFTNKDNQTVYTTDIVVDNIEFGESKSASQANQDNAPQEDSGFANVPDEKPDDGFMTVDDSDDSDQLPFN